VNDQAVREFLATMLAWKDAHAGFDAAVEGIPEEFRGKRAGAHSPWELVEHIRIAQHDILDFSRNKDYEEMEWPKDYWPRSPAPSSAVEWNRSIEAFRKDREALGQLALDTSIDLTATIPHGSGQTYLREIVLAADHTAYHVGQLILVRQLLGIWKS
jgi:DinB superfamily